MPGKRIFWKLFFAQSLLIVISLFIVGLYVSFYLRPYYLSQIASQLESSAILIRDLVKEGALEEKGERVNILAKRLGGEICSRVTIMDQEGVVRGDSEEDPQKMENHRDRPEVKEAMQGRVGRSTRYSVTLRKEMMYLALPIKNGAHQALGVVRVSLPLDEIKDRVGHIYEIVGWGGILAVIISLGLAFTLARKISEPISQMARAAQMISRGDLSQRIKVDAQGEIGDLSRSFNRMSEELERQMENLAKEVSEKEAVLSSMIEGVMAIDQNESVIFLNQAAHQMLELTFDDALGRLHWEVIRSPEINGLFKDVLGAKTSKAMEFHSNPPHEKTLWAQAAPIWRKDEEILGVVAVFHDVTEMRKLERARMEFIANVSHELRTPLTSIMGFVETLKGGAIHERECALNFLDIIERHAGRLNRLVTDLLELSQVETGKKKMTLKPIKLEKLINKVLFDLKESRKKNFPEITVNIPSDLPPVLADEEKIETVLENLLNNAIKYTPEGKKITVAAFDRDRGVEVSVADTGLGIPPRDLPRIFERFYRVDKARSRELGGTGLGLSIVKHIIEAHRGTIEVESKEGQGSKFSFTLMKHPA